VSVPRVDELKRLILKAKQAYYFGGKPLMSDAEYDALEDELRELDPGNPVLALVGAPVPADSILTKARHSIPMGSQNKVNDADDFRAWYLKAGGGGIHATLKGDGASAAAYYEGGALRRAISRGDGFEGEDITANAAKFKGLPLWVTNPDGRAFTGAIRFEVILTVADWGIVDPLRSKNPRNAGSGIMGRKNGENAELLSCFAFDLDSGPEANLGTELAKAERLTALGFTVVPGRLCQNAEECIGYFEEVSRSRDSLDFWIDGVVFKVNDLAQQAAMGITANRPKGQVAWKFDSKGAETTVESYSISVGHTGALIPTAQLTPVQIGGTTVSSALLNNWDEIRRLDVAVGDRVWLIKANDIIPKVVGVRARPPTRKPIEVPERCPVCDSPVRRRLNTAGGEGVMIECSSDECSAKSIGKLKRWINALDIQGIGDSVRLALVDQLDVRDAAGLYRLRDRPEALENLVINPEKELKLGKKRAATILEAIERTRRLTLVQFLGSLGIDRLAARRVELVIQQAGGALDTLDAWLSGRLRDDAEFAARVGLPSVGKMIQDSLDAKKDVISALLAAGVEISGVGVERSAPGDALPTVCISGKLPSGKKKGDYEAPLLTAGYRLVDDVDKTLDMLVVADAEATTGKAAKARKYGIRIITEEELVALLAAAR
jgi:DNA ligase (NAD+)